MNAAQVADEAAEIPQFAVTRSSEARVYRELADAPYGQTFVSPRAEALKWM